MSNEDERSKAFIGPDSPEWRELSPDLSGETDEEVRDQKLNAAKAAKEELKAILLSSLQMQHVSVLAGSGTSLGPVVKGPSMWTLWDFCVNENPGPGDEDRKLSTESKAVIEKVGYEVGLEGENIESLLSRCEAFQIINDDKDIEIFINSSKKSAAGKIVDFEGIEMKLVAVLETKLWEGTIGEELYTDNEVQRTTSWIYRTNNMVYELTSPEGDVYRMQSYSQIVDPNLTIDSLETLDEQLELPEGWRYEARRLTNDSVLKADGLAYVINDNLLNSYQKVTE